MTNCVKIVDAIELQDLEFYTGTPVICKDEISFFLIGLSNSKNRTSLNLQHVPGDLQEYMNEHYESGEPEMNSRSFQIDYQGTDFQQPDIFPRDTGCNGGDNNADNGGHSDNGNRDTDGNFMKNLLQCC